MSRINKLFRPLRMEQVIGQTNIKVIIKNTLASNNFSNFAIFYGSSGTGKSTVAEIVAYALTCENRQGYNPCLSCEKCKQNYTAINSGKPSNHIVKVNMGLVIGKKDLSEVIKEIFILQPSSGGNFVYILEEFHAIKAEDQIALLEELEHIPGNVFVFICTTRLSKIITEIRSRAVLFEFKLPNYEECKILIQHLCDSRNFAHPTEEVIRMIVRYAKNSPREIVKIMDLIFSSGNLSEEQISNYLGFVKIDVYTDILVACTYDMSEFLLYMNSLDLDLNDIVKGLKDFMMDVMLLLYGGKNIGFASKNIKDLKIVFGKFSEREFLEFMDEVGKIDSEEGLYGIVRLKRKLNNLTEKDIYKESRKEATKDMLKSEQISTQRQQSESFESKPLTSEYITNLTKSSIKFKK